MLSYELLADEVVASWCEASGCEASWCEASGCMPSWRVGRERCVGGLGVADVGVLVCC
ncbi:MAG: hypothetical protein P8104_00215 [Gammaproteobacteria bacterium]